MFAYPHQQLDLTILEHQLNEKTISDCVNFKSELSNHDIWK